MTKIIGDDPETCTIVLLSEDGKTVEKPIQKILKEAPAPEKIAEFHIRKGDVSGKREDLITGDVVVAPGFVRLNTKTGVVEFYDGSEPIDMTIGKGIQIHFVLRGTGGQAYADCFLRMYYATRDTKFQYYIEDLDYLFSTQQPTDDG